MNRTLLISSLIAALGGLLFGFDAAVISGTIDQITLEYNLTPTSLGFAVSSALIGTIVGALAFGWPSDKFGRRWALMLIALLFLVSAIGSALAWDLAAFVVFRFLGGLGIGGASVVSPMYIAEVSPARVRGRLVALAQLNIVLGILVAYFSNYLISEIITDGTDWRWMLGVEAVPAAAFYLLLWVTPHSPRWLVAKGRFDEARDVLKRVGSDHGSVDEEITAIRNSLAHGGGKTRTPLFQRRFRKPIQLAVAIAVFNQLSGISAVIYYAPSIFKMASASQNSAMFQSVVIGLANLIFTIAAIAVIDKLGRRKLMLVGSIGYILSLGTIAACFYIYGNNFTPAGGMILLGGLIAFVASHAFGQGAVIWVYLGEIFPNAVRASGQSLGSFSHWVMAAVSSTAFPILADGSGGHAFTFFGILMVGQLLWVIFVMPETRGVPLEEIERRLHLASPTSSPSLTPKAP